MSKNGKYDIVTVIGVSVSVLMLIGGMMYTRKQAAKQMQAAAQEQMPAIQQAARSKALEQKAPAAPPAPADEAGKAAICVPKDMNTPWVRLDQGVAKLGVGSDMILDIADDGTGCVKVELPKYYVEQVKAAQKDKAQTVQMGRSDYPYLALIPPTPQQALTKVLEQKATKNSYTLKRSTGDGTLVVTETWSLVADKPYEINYRIQAENAGKTPVLLSGYCVDGGAMATSVAMGRKASRGESTGGLSYAVTKSKNDILSMSNLEKMKPEKKAKLASTPVLWSAVHSKYFMMSMWMENGTFNGIECGKVAAVAGVTGSDRYHVRAILPEMTVAAGGKGTWSLKGYAGPKEYERLCSYETGLESVMDLDRFFFWRPAWMRWISRCLLMLLVWIRGWFPASIGYGMAVILLTLLVKIIFWPLAHKSTIAMRKMQLLKPQLDEIKEKYKDDPTTMYRKQQELFKQNNVSQLGGCLPMLLQIPVFFALFSTFRNAIELRHASFLWAYDLSMPDTLEFITAVPIRPFAILMAASMYLQQKMTPSADAQQAKMMSVMTIVFMFLFYGMPSALTLYLTVSYLLGILQTVLTNKLLPPLNAPVAAKASK